MDFLLERLTEATMLWSGFLAGLFLLRWLLPGPVQAGRVLGDGTREHYKVNGLALFVVVAVVVAVTQVTGLFSLVTVRRLFWPLFIVANVFAVLHTAWLFAVGRRHNRDVGTKPGGVLRDLWFGSELNPELWGVDLKLFGYVPSLLALWVVNLSFAMSQWEATGQLTSRVIVYETLVTLYIVNYFQFERGMVHTWDVVSERFGWMLVWGDYVLVPFFYSIAGWYVARNPGPMSAAQVTLAVILFAVGMLLFRGANSQKHRFKEQPATATTWGRPARTLGGELLVSGFWGVGRKLNYTGELLIYLSWTLCAGFESAAPYLLPAWLGCLFVHRAQRDHRKCRAQYGRLWDEYCDRVRFRMIPFVY